MPFKKCFHFLADGACGGLVSQTWVNTQRGAGGPDLVRTKASFAQLGSQRGEFRNNCSESNEIRFEPWKATVLGGIVVA